MLKSIEEKKKVLQDGIYDENKQQEDTKFSGEDLFGVIKVVVSLMKIQYK